VPVEPRPAASVLLIRPGRAAAIGTVIVSEADLRETAARTSAYVSQLPLESTVVPLTGRARVAAGAR
jgi:hypothetical protein